MKAIAIVFLASCGVALAGAPEGKTLFEAKCQGCHGPNGEGRPAVAKMFNVTMRPFSSKEVQAHSDAEFKKFITTGNGKMKPIAGVTDQQIDDVIAFVRTLKQ
jgi:mono/diheme cytochrome c family protein